MNGWKIFLTSWPQQFWENWAACRIVFNTHWPKIIPQTFFPKNSSPKILPQKLLTSNGCNKFLTSLKLPQQFWGKRAALRPVYTQRYQWPQKFFPKKYFPKILPQKWLTSKGCKNILTSLKLPRQLREKRAAFRPVLHTKIPMAPKDLPKTLFCKSSSPQIINIEWRQTNLDIMAPPMLRNMGNISPCFTHKDTNGPNNSSPKSLSQKFFPQND